MVLLSLALIAGIAFLLRTGRGTPVDAAKPRPALDSPAQVLLERGERVHGEIRSRVAGQPGWAIIGADAEHVVTDLAATAEQVAELHASLGSVDLGVLAAERDRLAGELGTTAAPGSQPTPPTNPTATPSTNSPTEPPAEAPPGRPDPHAAYHAVCERMAFVDRRIAERDALLGRMRSAVTGLERCRQEVDSLLHDGSRVSRESTAPILALTTRLAALRAGLTEVEEINRRGRTARSTGGYAGDDPDGTVPLPVRPPLRPPVRPPLRPPPRPDSGLPARPDDPLRDTRCPPGGP